MRPAVFLLSTLIAGAAGGGISSHILVQSANADSGGAMLVYVPLQGVVFRTVGGNSIVSLRSEAAGGVIEVLDARQQVALRLRATSAGGVIEGVASGTIAPSLLPLSISSGDPGY